MADRGRDLKFSILSDIDQFDTDKPARGLEDLADAAEAAGRQITEMEDSAQRGERATADLADEAKDTARTVDTAFDKIRKSSKANLRDGLDDDTKKATSSLHEVRDEANDTAREMGASFDGSIGSVMDGFQELGANAGAAFGPVGIAVGAAAAIGVGVIRAEAEKLKTLTNELVQEMLDAGGKLTEEAITQRVQAQATDDAAAFVALRDKADSLGLSFRDLARAKAGDGEAASRLLEHVAELSQGISDQAAAAGSASGEMYAQQTALSGIAKDLQTTAAAYDIATEATSAITDATAGAGGKYSDLRTESEELRKELHDPIEAKVSFKVPTSDDLIRLRSLIQNGIGTVVVPVRGQNVFTNNANNSRYRD